MCYRIQNWLLFEISVNTLVCPNNMVSISFHLQNDVERELPRSNSRFVVTHIYSAFPRRFCRSYRGCHFAYSHPPFVPTYFILAGIFDLWKLRLRHRERISNPSFIERI